MKNSITERERKLTKALQPSEFEARGLARSRYHDRLFVEGRSRPTNEEFDEGWEAARKFYKEELLRSAR